MSQADGNGQRRSLARVDCMPHAAAEWTKCGFRDLANVNPAYKLDPNGVYPFVEMAAVAEDFAGIKEFAPRQFQSGFSRFRQNDTIFAKITPCAEHGKVALVDDLRTDFATGSTEFIVLSPKVGVDPRYLFYLVSCPAVHRRAVSRMEGSTGRLRVSESTFTKWLWVALPGAEEQTRIAETLKAADDHLRALDEQIRQAERLATALNQFHFAVDASAAKFPYEYGTDRTIPRAWNAKRLGAFADITSGITLNQDREAAENGVRYLTVVNVYRGRIDLTEERHLELRGNEAESKILASSDILVVEGHANPAEIGRAALVTNREAGMSFQNHLFRVRLENETEVRAKFLVRALNSERVRRHWVATSKTSSGLSTINRTALRRLVLPVPKPEEQDFIVERLEAAEILVGSLNTQLFAARRVKQSLLQNLLTGKIRLQP